MTSKMKITSKMKMKMKNEPSWRIGTRGQRSSRLAFVLSVLSTGNNVKFITFLFASPSFTFCIEGVLFSLLYHSCYLLSKNINLFANIEESFWSTSFTCNAHRNKMNLCLLLLRSCRNYQFKAVNFKIKINTLS